MKKIASEQSINAFAIQYWTQGTYLWITAKDWSLWEEKLIMGPYIHHIAGEHGLLSPVLYEASKYINGVCFDPAEPSLNEIKDWLACRKK